MENATEEVKTFHFNMVLFLEQAVKNIKSAKHLKIDLNCTPPC